jgi:glutaminase
VYPALARVPNNLFGICVVSVDGRVFAVGDAEHEFTTMSVSKAVHLCVDLRCDRRNRRA